MKKLFDKLWDENRPLNERLFILLSALGLGAMALMALIGFILGETIADVVIITVCVIVFSIIITVGIRNHRINESAIIVISLIILVLLPLTFFNGGGIMGGSPLWFIFSTLFINLAVNGRAKYFLICLSGIVAVICYSIGYYHPELISHHTVKTAYIDSLISIILVGAVLSFMFSFEIRILRNAMDQSMEKSREIEALNETQNKFFSSMSHEIRTPINTIIGLNEMILREDISPDVAEDARNIQSASKMLLSVINDILDMSKIESGKMEIVPVAYDVGSMLSDVISMVVSRANKKGLKLIVDVDPSMPQRLFADEVRIKQILLNILNNSVKYTPEGSVNFSVHCRVTEQHKAIVTYSVEDTGIGIKKENLPYLFDAFQRLDENKNRYIEGTGLGLSIVKQLIDLMGGEISVNSVYTKGTTFEVVLEQEIVDETAIGNFQTERLKNSMIQGGYTQSFEAPEAKILIVDDNSANLLVATKLLRDTKVQTDTANSGRECLQKTLKNHYHVILMDHMMPEMDGIECLHAIREQPGGLCRDIPIIILTANAGGENAALYRREGFDDYLVKPVDITALEQTLISFLPDELVKTSVEKIENFDSDKIVKQMRKRIPLLITTESVADLPDELTEGLNIPIIPYSVHTDRGVFTDMIEADSDVILKFMQESNMKAKSKAPTVEEYESFFAEQLTKAQHILHISMAKRSGIGYANASEAALSFYNVRVVDSGHLSSGMGLVALAANQLASDNYSASEQVAELVSSKIDRIHTSFIPKNTEYLYRAGFISNRVHRLCSALMLHPVITMRDSTMVPGAVRIGSLENARDAYIKNTFKNSYDIDTSALFITYAGIKKSELYKIRDKVLSYVNFEKVYFQKASTAISVNCGPGTFGFIFARK